MGEIKEINIEKNNFVFRLGKTLYCGYKVVGVVSSFYNILRFNLNTNAFLVKSIDYGKYKYYLEMIKEFKHKISPASLEEFANFMALGSSKVVKNGKMLIDSFKNVLEIFKSVMSDCEILKKFLDELYFYKAYLE